MSADDPREAAQHVVEGDEAVGQDHALDRRVRDVALVPERDVLERRQRVAAEQPREADDLLAADRVALVRHRRRALLARRERLLDLADLGLLQPADLERELLERRGGDGERRQQLGVAVALDDLRRDRRGLEAEPRADRRFDRRVEVRERADGPGELADVDRGARRGEPARCSAAISAYQSASFRPNVIGSACTPCVRPIIGVCWCSSARSRIAVAPAPSSPSRIRSHASRICSACAVSITSDEVRPKCSQRASSPTLLGHGRREGDDVVLVFASISSMRAMSKPPRSRIAAAAAGRDDRRRRPSPRPPRSRPAARSRTAAARSRCGPSRRRCNEQS